jgi:hypothetical protein
LFDRRTFGISTNIFIISDSSSYRIPISFLQTLATLQKNHHAHLEEILTLFPALLKNGSLQENKLKFSG